jgi:hypothetical protein
MSRKSLLLAVGIILFVVGAVAATLALLVHHVPAFYHRCAVPPGRGRFLHSKAFLAEALNLWNSIQSPKSKWTAIFTEAQVNSYFEEHFVQSKTHQNFLLPRISAPRVAMETGKIRLAFRYGQGLWSSIISVDMRVWLAKHEPNVVALELQGLHAGALPISSQSLLERISEICQRNAIDVKWHRYNGNPVALLRFQSNSARPTVQLAQLELRQGMLVVGVRPVLPVRPTPGLAPSAH